MSPVVNMLTAAVAAFSLLTPAWSQFPPPQPDMRIVYSKVMPGAQIAYREPGICETTPGVKSFSGYLTLPPNTFKGQNFPVNTFFWYFEARRRKTEESPLSIWLNGGPGSSSMIGLMQEHGPCFVNRDSKTTKLNPYSWNNYVNMLYIDQPNQVGFSYDYLVNGTLNNARGYTETQDFGTGPIPQGNATFMPGTFSSQKPMDTSNSTRNAAVAMWHFSQMWFQEFPEYKPLDDRISIWTESYGGRYGPAFSAYFEKMNQLIRTGQLRGSHSKILHLDTLGIINGCIDLFIQAPSYPRFSWNNTYGIQAITEQMYKSSMSMYMGPGGCREQILKCRDKARKLDPYNYGLNSEVNQACRVADAMCNSIENVYINQGSRGYYDIAHGKQDPFPPDYYLGYLNQASVQYALGAKVNFSSSSNAAGFAFTSTGDYPRGGFLEDIAYLVDRNIKVHLLYGDRDYACNWLGGEDVSLNIPYKGAAQFRKAGYTPVNLNGETKAMARQFGNFSFTRIFQAGHELPAYQGELALELFHRAMFNRDIATGQVDTTQNVVVTKGASSTWNIKQAPPPIPPGECYILDQQSCTDAQWSAILDGSAIIKDNIYVGKDGG